MATPASSTILPNERRGYLIAGWIGTLIFAGFLTPFWIALLTDQGGGDVWFAYVIIGLFSFFALIAVFHMAKVTLSVLRFGDVALHLHEPPRAGGRLKAYLDLRKHDVLRTVSLKLVCNKVRWTRGSKGSRNRSDTEFWVRGEPRAPVSPLGAQARVNFVIDIPPHVPGTTVPTDATAAELDRDYFDWKLELSADVPGVDLVRTYEFRVEHAAGAPAPQVESAARKAPPPVPAEIDFSLWQRPSAWVLVAANVVPAVGVLFFGWELLPIMVLFWIENVFVGAFNVLRILNAAQGGAQKFFLIPFFIFHYGMFCLVHGLFVMVLFGREFLEEFGLRPDTDLSALSTVAAEFGLMPAVIALGASHAYSYFANYLGRGEYREANAGVLMFTPYGRVVVLHVLILVGGILIEVIGSPAAFIALLVVLKTALDLYAHGREHRKYAGLLAAGETKPAGPVVDAGESPIPRMAISAALVAALVALIQVHSPPPAERLSPEALASAGQARNPAPPPLPTATKPAASRPAPKARAPGTVAGPPTPWDGPIAAWAAQYEMAEALRSKGKLAEAEERLRATLTSMESWSAGAPPEAARILSVLADLHHDQGDRNAYEAEMARAIEILEKFDPVMVRQRLGTDGDRIDKEVLAREFGDYYWEQRRYDRGLEYYSRAHDAGLKVDVTEEERNRRLAFSAAGMMATACVLDNFEVADRAMAELKERIRTVDSESKRKLDYWVRTGEPRLKSRKC